MTESRATSNDPPLQPFQLKHLRLRNRIMSTSHEPAYSEDGKPKLRYQLYHEEKAKGGICIDRIYQGGEALCIHNAATGREETMPHVVPREIEGRPQPVTRNRDGRFQLFRVGDAVASRNIHAPIYDSLRRCKDL
ncbi:MAG: hypothetical protein R3286_10010 [Gammaproteobacteria bacterium]|nr:hypothetical protein [Gammaproteobacteria bacterium]